MLQEERHFFQITLPALAQRVPFRGPLSELGIYGFLLEAAHESVKEDWKKIRLSLMVIEVKSVQSLLICVV